MKNKFSYSLLALIMIISISSCKKSISEENLKVEDRNIALLIQNGFNSNSIIDKNEFYIIEQDMIVFKKDLATSLNIGQPLKLSEMVNARTKHYSVQQAYSTQIIATSIYMYIDDSFGQITGTDWEATITDAISNWNAITNFGIQFYITTNSSIADITIVNGGLPSGQLAGGALPSSNSAPGNVIYIDLSQSSTDASVRLATFIHEIGHTIGLRHTDSYGESGTLNTITGTVPSTYDNTNPDVLSIFNTYANAYNGGLWNGFSDRDRLAIRNLYPLDNTQKAFYRYAGNYGTHFYTTNWNALGYNTPGWVYENYEGFVFSSAGTGRAAIYRYLNSNGDHFYTQNFSELGYGGGSWSYEGVDGYGYSSYVIGSVPLYRFYNSSSKHFYSRNLGEGRGKGYIEEGVLCYVIP